MMPCDHCPIGDGCRSYVALCDNMAKNPDRWRPVLDRVNGLTPPPEPPAEYPPLATQAASAIGAAVRFAASGFATVDQDEYDRRRAICEACEHYDGDRNRCRACGCQLSIKPWSAKEECPKGKWAVRSPEPI
jgi:hypothetical protein